MSRDKRQPGHYVLDKINIEECKVFPETFDSDVPRNIVVTTKKVKVICRFVYDDEDKENVMKSWVKLDYLNL